MFSCKKNSSTRFREPYSDVFKSYSDVLKPYSGVFLQFMEHESLKLDFDVDFFLTLNQSSYKLRLKNSSFILELEFQTLEILVFNIVLKRDNKLNFLVFIVIQKKNSKKDLLSSRELQIIVLIDQSTGTPFTLRLSTQTLASPSMTTCIQWRTINRIEGGLPHPPPTPQIYQKN